MRQVHTNVLAAAVIASLAVPAAAKDDRPTPALIDALARCLTITADAERLACHDAAARRLVEATTKREVVVVDRDEVKRTKRSLFGFALPRIGLFGSKGPDNGAETTRIEGSIKRVLRGANGNWTFVLDDEAVWTTTEAWTGSVDPKAGMAVTIKRGALGGYIATVPGGRATRVMRTG